MDGHQTFELDEAEPVPAESEARSRNAPRTRVGRWLGRMHVLPVATAVVILATVVCFWFAIDQPHVGVRLQPDHDTPGLEIVALEPSGAAARAGLSVGDVLVAISSEGQSQRALPAELGFADPDFIATQAEIFAMFDASGEVAAHLRSGPVSVTLSDGAIHAVQPAPYRPVLSLLRDDHFLPPFLFGSLAFAIGVLIWAHGRRGTVRHLLLAAGTTNALLLWSASIMWSRELALPEGVFRIIFATNQLGALFYPATLLALLLIYPTVLLPWRQVRWLFAIVGVLWIQSVVPVLSIPFRWFFIYVVTITLVALPVMAAQWRRTRRKPIERAQASLLAFSCLVLAIGVATIYVLPIAFSGQYLGGTLALSGLMTMVPFIGFAIGAARYRLFDLPRWWFMAAVWFVSGLLIIVVELSVFLFLGTRHITSLAIATLAVGWIYFPLRQFLFERVFRARRYATHEILPDYLQRLSEVRTTAEFDHHLEAQTSRLFAPAALSHGGPATDAVRIEQSGLVLALPAASPGRTLRLEGAANASRLFNRGDVALAETIVDLTRRYRTQIEAIETSLGDERKRIARDLHDTVGAKMVSLIHGAPTPGVARKARDACRALIDTIWLLRSDEDQPLALAVSKWAEEARERAEDAQIALDWNHGDMRAIHLPAQTIVNLGNILREAMSNIIRHSRATAVAVSITQEGEGYLRLEVCHDGAPSGPSEWRRGFGLQGIDERVSELGGAAEWTDAPGLEGGVRMGVTIPIAPQSNSPSRHRPAGRQPPSGVRQPQPLNSMPTESEHHGPHPAD